METDQADDPSETEVRTLSRRRVLIVEDDPDHAELLKDILLERKALVSHAIDGADCLSQDLSHFDIILLDQNLPDSSGTDLLCEIVTRSDIPVIMVTSEDNYQLAVQAIQLGAYDYICKAGDYLRAIPVVIEKNLEQHRLKLENQRLQVELEKRLEESRQQNVILQHLSTTDYLTGLHNHRYLQERIEEELNLSIRKRIPVSVIMVDLDHFKKVNDVYGHLFGDQVLREVAEILKKSTRACDTVARYGGEEFLILLPATELEGAVMIAERALEQIRSWKFDNEGTLVPITASSGVAGFIPSSVGRRENLVAKADRAMYRAKELGRDQVCFEEE
jgi:diguanylate cyclase (GGDEF)-like protein